MTSAPVTPLAGLLLAAMLGGAATASAMPRPQARPAGHATLAAAAPHLVVDAPDRHRSVDPGRSAGNPTANGKGSALDETWFGRRSPQHAEPYWTARTVPPPSPPYGLAASYPPPPYVPAYPRLPGYPPLPPH